MACRGNAIWTIGQHWKPALDPDEYDKMLAEAGGNDNQSADEPASSADTFTVKAHRAQPMTTTESAIGILQESKKPDKFTHDGLVQSHSIASQSKVHDISSARSPSKALQPGAINNENSEHN